MSVTLCTRRRRLRHFSAPRYRRLGALLSDVILFSCSPCAEPQRGCAGVPPPLVPPSPSLPPPVYTELPCVRANISVNGGGVSITAVIVIVVPTKASCNTLVFVFHRSPLASAMTPCTHRARGDDGLHVPPQRPTNRGAVLWRGGGDCSCSCVHLRRRTKWGDRWGGACAAAFEQPCCSSRLP